MKQSVITCSLIILLSCFQAQVLSDRLSKDNEELIFSFRLASNGKIATLCKDKKGKYLVYRFGTKDKIELEFPKVQDATSWTVFKLYGAKRFGGKANAGFGDYSVSFINNKVSYEVFETWSDEEETNDIGLRVTINGKKLLLKGTKKSQVGSLLKFDDENNRIKNTVDDEQ